MCTGDMMECYISFHIFGTIELFADVVLVEKT